MAASLSPEKPGIQSLSPRIFLLSLSPENAMSPNKIGLQVCPSINKVASMSPTKKAASVSLKKANIPSVSPEKCCLPGLSPEKHDIQSMSPQKRRQVCP